MIPCGHRDAYVVGVVPFFFSIFLIRKRMMNAKDTEEKREEEKSLFSSRIIYDKYNYNEKKDKDSLKIYMDYGSKTLLILW